MFKSCTPWVLVALSTIALTALVTLALCDSRNESLPVVAGATLPEDHAAGPVSAKEPETTSPTLVRVRQMSDSLPPVSQFPIVSRALAEGKIDDAEFVLGVVIGAEARAYPLDMMADPKRELLNDQIGSQPIAVAWCDQCQCPRVFSRLLDGKTLSLAITGETLGSNMIIKDLETGSEWVELLGESTAGPLKGKRFTQITSVWTDWKTWRSKHPETTVLMMSRVVTNYRHVPQYSDYSSERDYFAKLQWGLVRDAQARSWPLDQLAKQDVVNDVIRGEDLVIIFDRRSSTVTAFDRELKKDLLTFSRDGADLIDDRTHSVWDPITGSAKRGPYSGERLRPVPGIVSMAQSWKRFHPGTEVWTAPRS